MSGLQKRYYAKLYRIGKLKKKPYSQVWKYKDDIRKMHKLQEQYLFLVRHKIESAEELVSVLDNLTDKKKEASKGENVYIDSLTYEQFMMLGDAELSRRFSMQDEAEQKAKIDREQANELEYVDESQKADSTATASGSSGNAGGKPVRNPEREKPKWEDTITNRMLHWSYTPEQKEELKMALAAGIPRATILTYFYPEVTVEKMSSYRKKQ